MRKTEIMDELRRNTTITERARTEAAGAQVEATAAEVAASGARDEAAAAHQGAREIIDRIDEATRKEGEQ